MLLSRRGQCRERRERMSQDKISLDLHKREVVGKRLRALRASGQVPVVIHDHGKDSISAQSEYRALFKVYQQAGKHHPVELNVEGKKILAIIKDAHFEPVKHALEHAVFQCIRQNEKVKAEVPVELVGEEIPAEKKGLLILRHLEVVEIEALPKNLPDKFEVDATSLAEEGDKLTVANIVVPEGVTILTDPEHGLASVEVPRDQIAEANAAAESLAADTGIPEESPESASKGDSSDANGGETKE